MIFLNSKDLKYYQSAIKTTTKNVTTTEKR